MTANQSPRILILGNYCSANRGDAAILSGLIELLRHEYPTVEITVSSYFPELAEQIHGVPAVPPLLKSQSRFDTAAYTKFRRWSKYYGKRWSRSLATKMLPSLARHGLDVLAAADIVISSGGTYLNDNYRPSILGRLHELELALAFGKPVLLLGHSIGPFAFEEYRQLARKVLGQVDAIGVRDEESVRILTELGIVGKRVTVTGDTAFFIRLADPTEVQAIASRENLSNNDGLRISVSVRRWRHYRSGNNTNAHEAYVEKMARVCDYVADRHQARVVFLSTCTGLGGYAIDDRVTAKEVLARMKNPGKAQVVLDELNAEQLAALYSLMHLHIGTRLHSVILAMMGGTPSVAVAYEFKSRDFMHQMGLSEYIVDINDFTEDDLISRIDRALVERDTLSQKVAKGVERARQDSKKNLNLVQDVLATIR